MTIRAILRNGQIQPLDPLPSGWGDGQELVVESHGARSESDEIDRWEREMDALVERIPLEDQERLQRALEEVERESKDAVRREWGLK